MKKMTIIIVLMLSAFLLLAEKFPVNLNENTNLKSEISTGHYKRESRWEPDWEWDVAPVNLLTNYADYFQAYNQTPVALQPEEHGGGIYILYRVKDQAGNSEVSYSYIDADGNVLTSQGIGEAGYYCDAVVDQNTGDVFGTWHVAIEDGSETMDCIAIYDLYHIMNSHGLWKDPVITVLDSDEQDELDPTLNDEFIWPQIAIGPSPIAGKQRIYIVASNHIVADGTEANPSENVMIMMADFEQIDLDNQSDLEWTYNTVPMFDAWNSGSPYWYRPFKSFTVIDNQLIFMGYKVSGDEALDQNDQLFCFINENYGEGDNWSYNFEDLAIELDNPNWVEEGELWYLYSDLSNYPTPPATEPWPLVELQLMNTGHFNLVPTENNTKVTWAGAMGITFDQGEGPGYYFQTWFQLYPKTFSFDLVNEEFSFTNVYPMALAPWDLDGDGEIDQFTEDEGRPTRFPDWVEDWPVFHFDTENAFHYNEYFLTTNDEHGWMAFIWVDGKNATKANEGWEGYEDWAAKPELAVCISYDWGNTWYDPIFINANPESENYMEELDGMIPCFAYPGDRIEDLGDGHGLLHLFFLDDNDYGSFHNSQQGLNNGSTFEYAAIDINFFTPPPDVDDEYLVVVPLTSNNYPNPFNPQTTIAFEQQEAGDVRIDIYNLKGQKISTLADGHFESGTHKVVWNADDQASGVYFYKIKHGKYTTSKKMILMK